ncbi:hypothetical protein PR048_011781 [Dryococelus australis]|uniref:Uncharacterized protein n=1 Tax=Dryococelus australis TaxID=614101 RepID=A0ABQ9HML6_9NEOP|nr:hypothetical protein PR048_011781 [Dryococelus australis]
MIDIDEAVMVSIEHICHKKDIGARDQASLYIDFPKSIRNLKVVINLQSQNHMCFKWVALAHIKGKTLEYLETKFNFIGLEFLTPLKQIALSENNYPGSSINVYDLDDEKVVRIKVAKEEKINTSAFY